MTRYIEDRGTFNCVLPPLFHILQINEVISSKFYAMLRLKLEHNILIPVCLHYFQDFYEVEKQKLLKNTGLTEKGCIVWYGCGDARYGRKYFKFPGQAPTYMYTHRLSYLLHNRLESLPPHVDISHRCHTPRCVRADHLVAEPHGVNMDRNTCHLQNKCTKNHYPPCIL